MARDRGYREAEQRIEKARRKGATELNLRNMRLTELPEVIGQLVNLKVLNLGGDSWKNYKNQLTELPESLGKLSQLQSLDLSGNQLTKLPESLGKLSQLQSLKLSSNQLTKLPESLGKLSQLHYLKISSNQLTTLPDSLAQLSRLEELDLRSGQFENFPNVIRYLKSLRVLHFNHNKLQKVPKWIDELVCLEELILNSNQLATLPDSIGKLPQLKILYIGMKDAGNPLGLLPQSMSQLQKLSLLYADNCRLNSLPEWLFKLQHLKELHFKNNQLIDLPPCSPSLLEHLKILDLDDNPLNPELAAAYDQGLDAVKAYLRAKAEDQIVLNEAKLILIGEGEVGKTSLLAALRGDDWVENRKTTHGVEVDIKSLVLTDPESNTEIKLNGWDFGGQNIYRHTHQIFFTAPAIYLAVWNPRRGPEQCCVDEWIEMVKHRAYDETRPEDKPRILVVATHGGPKERLDYIDEQSLRDEFGDLIVDFYHVDSKSKYGLDELKQIISQTAANIPQVGRSVPASWKKVLDAVRQRSETDAWITYEQFQTLCAEQNVDLTLAKTYAAILNELGHLIHYSTDPILKDIVILKPEWLSKAISFVLEDKQVKEQNGLVRHSHLTELWDDPARGADRYPQNLHQVFLKLMERCDLSYQVEFTEADAPPTSLMAQLVPSKRPEQWEQDWVLKPGDTERTQICRILDAETGRTTEVEGLMYRLIVRLHRYSLGRNDYYKSRHWKNGMLLDDEFNGRAFIEEIGGDIYVTVRAAYPIWFLGHLCSEIEWLVKSFWKGLEPRLHLPCPTDNCKGLLERDEIIECMEEEITKVRCPVCRKFHKIDSLIPTATAKPEWQNAVTELKQGQQLILNAFETNFDSLSVQLRTLMSQADEQYEALLTTLTDPAKDGPRLFSFEPVNRSKFNPRTWTTEKFRVTLWCEHKRVPLPVLNGEGDKRGVYEIELTRDWVKKASPILRIISLTLKLALPIAIPGTKLETNDEEYKAISEQLEFGVKSADSFLKGSEQVGDWLIEGDAVDFDQSRENTRDVIRAQGSVLRELHAFLKAKDPSSSFGELVRVQNKRREFLWVHPNFIDEY